MLNIFKSLLGVARAADASSSDLESALASAEAQAAAATKEIAAAEAAYQSGLLDSDDAGLARLRAAREAASAAASAKQDRAALLVTTLRQRIAAVQVEEDEAGRRERYAAAKRATAAAKKVLETKYPHHAGGIVDIFRQIAEADLLVIAANESLPAGAERLLPTETLVRREPDTPERVLKDEVFTAWCGPRGHRLDPEAQAAVEPNPDGVTGIWRIINQPPVTVTLRRFRRITRVREIPGRSLPSLASTLNLPPLAMGHLPFWQADAVRHPAGILEHLDRTAPLWGKALGPEPVASAPEVEIVSLDDDAAAA